MKISVPVNGQSLEESVSPSFGRAAFFMLKDTETNEVIFIENTAADAQGGAGIKAAQLLVDQGVDVVLSPRLGKNAADVLEGSKIQLFKTNDKNVAANIEDYLAKQLEALTDIHPGFHGTGFEEGSH